MQEDKLKKWAKDLMAILSKKYEKQLEKMLNIISHQVKQVQTTVLYYFTPARIVIIKKAIKSVGKSIERAGKWLPGAGNGNEDELSQDSKDLTVSMDNVLKLNYGDSCKAQ